MKYFKLKTTVTEKNYKFLSTLYDYKNHTQPGLYGRRFYLVTAGDRMPLKQVYVGCTRETETTGYSLRERKRVLTDYNSYRDICEIKSWRLFQ